MTMYSGISRLALEHGGIFFSFFSGAITFLWLSFFVCKKRKESCK